MTILNILVPIFASAVLSLADVKTDFDHSADFGKYKTYSWIATKTSGDRWADRIVRDVDVQLAAKGWTKLQAGGDAVVSAFGRTSNGRTLQSFYADLGGPWKWQGIGTSSRTANDTPVGTLVIDVFDGKTKKLLWTGSATETLSSKPDSNTLEQSIQYMFRDFPVTPK